MLMSLKSRSGCDFCPTWGWYLTARTINPEYQFVLRHSMTTYLRSLVEGSLNASKRRPSSFYDSKPLRLSRSRSGSDTPPAVSSSAYSSGRNRSPESSTSCPAQDRSLVLVLTHTKDYKHHHHHNHHPPNSLESLILSQEHDRRTTCPIYLAIVSHPSRASSTDSSTPTSSHCESTTSITHSSLRPVLKKSGTWQPGSHTRTQHHVSFANPNIPDVLHMHPLLASGRLNRAPISYDLRFLPSSTSVVDRRTRMSIPIHTLSEPATDPPKSTKLVLRCDDFPWPVIVHPQRPGAITNLDLLYAVHSMLSTRVTHEEWDALGHGTHAQLKAAKAYEVRCTELGGGWDDGVRRIDWLGETTCLVGVEVDKSASECGVGKLVFAKP
ncbi:hypothetical protein DFS33DRAFT_1346439 [Desarmillaria ectypa]|nr:hypothetical protein DFS33DRAFT_1346439 [Desarmillaria ectypa]